MFQLKTRAGQIAGATRYRPMIAAAAAGLTLAAVATPRAGAEVTVYSNISPSSFSGILYPYSPYNTTANVDGTTYASLVADDITPIAGYAGDAVTSVVFSLANTATDPKGDPVPVTVDADLRFYAADGSGGGPGTLLFAADVGPISLAANASLLEPVTFPTTGPQFLLPSGTFYAGVSFSDGGGTTGITADQLANVGQLVYDPPTIGSSADSFFQSDGAEAFLGNNPAGDPTINFGGAPAANFAWQINVPEPASAGMIGVAAAAGLARRRRRVQI